MRLPKSIDTEFVIMIIVAICFISFMFWAVSEGVHEREIFVLKCSQKDGRAISTTHGRVCLNKSIFIEILE